MSSYKTKVGIYLSDFNPFFSKHKEIIGEALREGIGTVWVVPKEGGEVPIDERFWMAHYELEYVEEARVLVVTTESGQQEEVEQLKKIIRGYGSRNFEFWLIGKTEEIENWKDGDWILANFKILEKDTVTGEEEVLRHRGLGDDLGLLGDDGDVPLFREDRGQGAEALLPDEDLPAAGGHQAGDHAHQRGLAGAVFPDEAVDLPLFNGEVHVPEGDGPRVELGDVL